MKQEDIIKIIKGSKTTTEMVKKIIEKAIKKDEVLEADVKTPDKDAKFFDISIKIKKD